MTKPAKITIILVGLIALGFGTFTLFERPLAQAALQRAVDANVGVDRSAVLADGLHVYVCGSGSPIADPDRAGPCLGVLAGRHALIFDVGAGSMRVLGRMGFPIGQTERLFLTHLHSDHFDGLGELMVQSWIPDARSTPLPVSGPLGTAEVAEGFNLAYRIDSTYRIAHHGTAVANPAGYGLKGEEIVLPDGVSSQLVLDEGDLTVTAIRVSHDPVDSPFGFLVTYKGRSVAISGDTAYYPPFAEAAKGAEVLFHEALDVAMVGQMEQAARKNGDEVAAKVLSDIPDYHTSPVDAARIATLTNARVLVFYHTTPPMPSRLIKTLFLEGTAEAFSGEIRIGEDGDLVSLPAASTVISYRNLLD